jgi:hypothetical protein
MALGHKATRTRPTRHAENGGGLAVLKQNASGGSDPPTTGKGSNGSMLIAESLLGKVQSMALLPRRVENPLVGLCLP